jgi:hypothetical protein
VVHIIETEKNPWVILEIWKLFRDAVEGHPGKAPEARDARRGRGSW